MRRGRAGGTPGISPTGKTNRKRNEVYRRERSPRYTHTTSAQGRSFLPPGDETTTTFLLGPITGYWSDIHPPPGRYAGGDGIVHRDYGLNDDPPVPGGSDRDR